MLSIYLIYFFLRQSRSWQRSVENGPRLYQGPDPDPSYHNDLGTKLCSAIHRTPLESRHWKGARTGMTYEISQTAKQMFNITLNLTAPASEAALVLPRLRTAFYVHCITGYSTYTRVRRGTSSIKTVPRTKRETLPHWYS